LPSVSLSSRRSSCGKTVPESYVSAEPSERTNADPSFRPFSQNAINYYSPTIFRSIGITGSSTSLFTTGIFGVIKTIGGIVWCFLIIDHFGRRAILLVGAVGGAISMMIIAGYIAVADPANNPTTSLPPGGIAGTSCP
jgi:MFS family permease